MKIADWLQQQKELYTTLSEDTTQVSIHPVSGIWQPSTYLKSQYWWGGGATQKSCEQLGHINEIKAPQIGVLTFGPVQSFLGGGQRLRDWAVASWLCHYLTAVIIYHWEKSGGNVLLPLHFSVPLVQWLQGTMPENERDSMRFWQAELPNVITGIFPNKSDWLEEIREIVRIEWIRFLKELDRSANKYSNDLFRGIGWQVIYSNNQHLWSIYSDSCPLNLDSIAQDIQQLHQSIEAQKIGRSWTKDWWAGRTSPSAGELSIWHQGLKPIAKKGLWGLPDKELNKWWENLSQTGKTDSTEDNNQQSLIGLFSKSDRLNGIELVRRLSSVPHIIEPTLKQLWHTDPSPPRCPWGTFPDRTAVAAAWIPNHSKVDEEVRKCWNENIETLEGEYFVRENKANKQRNKTKKWGMPTVDKQDKKFGHPRCLERRNILESSKIVQEQDKDAINLEVWELFTKGWESTIEWTVGWRGDGDRIGEWLSGKQYQKQDLSWSRWHLTQEIIDQYQLNIEVPNVPDCPKKLDTPHILDLSVLFNHWNSLLYDLTQNCHDGKVIFAGGDDFLLLGPLTEAVSLTTDLHHLWTGKEPLSYTHEPEFKTEPLVDGWIQYNENTIYPVPGEQMTFSLGVVIAQRRIPQSLWHRGLIEAYQKAKQEGRNRVCLKILFNSGQSIDWVCPWPLWHLLMSIELKQEDKTDLNRWEKLLHYFESTHFSQESQPSAVKELLNTLWRSVGLDLTWEKVEQILDTSGDRNALQTITGYWQWWKTWFAVQGFLCRQQRERDQWLSLVKPSNENS